MYKLQRLLFYVVTLRVRKRLDCYYLLHLKLYFTTTFHYCTYFIVFENSIPN